MQDVSIWTISMHIGKKSSGNGMDYAHKKLKIPYSFFLESEYWWEKVYLARGIKV